LIPALDSVFIMIAIGFVASFWVLFAWKAASSWLSWLEVVLLEVVLLELLSASLAAAWE
jgi:hypothetical protein